MKNLPRMTMVIAAYNEADIIEEKIENTLALAFPENDINIIVVCDGSSDDTAERARNYPHTLVLHRDERKGKMAAVDRAMSFVRTPVTVFSDANTNINQDALLKMASHFQDETIGIVSGEKKVLSHKGADAAEGEGLYWKYESALKRLDAKLHTVVGVAGELFAIRTHLFITLPSDAILDDFIISTNVIKMGYRVGYEPEAVATEWGSASLKDEWKRKTRISAGGIQAVGRTSFLSNLPKYGWSSFVYLFHRISRWTIAPVAYLLLLLSSGALSLTHPFYLVVHFTMIAGLVLTLGAIKFEKIKIPKLLLPLVYGTFMHLAVVVGAIDYVRGKKSVNWEKAKRIKSTI